jgi:hypothetical protein
MATKKKPAGPLHHTTTVNLGDATITVGATFDASAIHVLQGLADAMAEDAVAAQKRADVALKIADTFKSGAAATLNIGGDMTIGMTAESGKKP